MAVLHGYKHTLRYQAGLAAGVFLLMFLSAWLSTTILSLFPTIEPMMRYLGVAYILYLAFAILRASYTFAERETPPLGFVHGFLLQLLNPKLIVYAFTLFSAFLTIGTTDVLMLVLTASLLALIAFCATSTWALFGTAIKTHLRHPAWKTAINILLSLSLVYTAVSLTGLMK